MITIDKITGKKGEDIKINVENDLIHNYDQLQVEIFDTGKENPKSILGFGTKPTYIKDNKYSVSFSTKSFPEGIFEIKLIRLHTPKVAGIDESIDFKSEIDFDRLFFRLSIAEPVSTTQDELSKTVKDIEDKLLKNFFSGIDISKSDSPDNFVSFVFIKGLKTGIRYRLNKIEVLPLDKGLDSIDTINVTNHFLKNYTKTGAFFEYGENESNESQNHNPISIIHIPKIKADNINDVIFHSITQTNYLLQAFSLIRGASGSVINIVIINSSTGVITRHLPREPYIGNLLTGGLAGENPEVLNSYIESLEKNSFKSLLVSLHKEALSEKNESFSFLRFWNILETLAVSKNYDSSMDLLDYSGNIIYDESINSDPPSPKKLKGTLNIVYNLIREHGIGNTDETFDNVKMWLGLRNAAAHFGSIYNYNGLNSNRDKVFAQKAIEVIKKSNGYNPILNRMKDDVKMILMREIT